MTTEQNQPQVPQAPMGPAPQGQQQAHRRRRRRRKGKNNGQPNAQANGQPSTQQQKPSNRPKKQSPKFFSKNNGGAQAGNGQGNRRKNKQRRPQVFVGPMDHSYRIANGNVADAPPSTIQLHSGNGGNGSNAGFHSAVSPQQPIPVREDAPTRIFCFIEDLFFLAKTQEVARKLGVKVSFVKNDKESLAKLTAAPEAERPSLIVFDLNNANAKPLTLIPKIKAKLKRGTSVIGFLSHLQGDLKMKAIEAGCDTVMPRSAFSQNLPNLLRRYGMEEEEEMEYQPVSG